MFTLNINKWFLVLVAATLLAACESNPPQSAAISPPKSEMQFVDLQGFDKDLASALAAPLPRVDVAFYDRIAPSALPDRLQQWMASVQAGGGEVKVTPPKSSLTSKSPLLLISAVTTLWSASKMAKELAAKAQFKSAQAYDAEIILKLDDKGDTLVEKVVFSQRKK